MRHDPPAGFRNTLVEVLTLAHQMPEEEATQIAAHISKAYLTCINLGDRHFALLNVTLQWQALCGSAVRGDLVLSGGRFAGLPLIGVLRWFDRMRSYMQFNAPYAPDQEDLDLDHIEATTCMALWKQGAEAKPYSPEDTTEALLERVNALLGERALAPIDIQRLRDAMDRLRKLGCLRPHAGWYRLREEMKYQVPEE